MPTYSELVHGSFLVVKGLPVANMLPGNREASQNDINNGSTYKQTKSAMWLCGVTCVAPLFMHGVLGS
eukprot:520323-Amphidinium_carterae.1